MHTHGTTLKEINIFLKHKESEQLSCRQPAWLHPVCRGEQDTGVTRAVTPSTAAGQETRAARGKRP